MDALEWLDFDYSEDADGHGSFDAMAACSAAQFAALQAEIVRVLAWSEAGFGPPRPLDDGGEWDFELQGVREVPTPLAVDWAPGARALQVRAGATGPERVSLSLTITGTPAFCAAFRQAFAA
jgi:hypothetical protein